MTENTPQKRRDPVANGDGFVYGYTTGKVYYSEDKALPTIRIFQLYEGGFRNMKILLAAQNNKDILLRLQEPEVPVIIYGKEYAMRRKWKGKTHINREIKAEDVVFPEIVNFDSSGKPVEK